MRGQLPMRMSRTPWRRWRMSSMKRESFSSASRFFFASFSGLSTSMNGSPTYDSGMMSDIALCTVMPTAARSFSRMSTASPTLSPAVHTT